MDKPMVSVIVPIYNAEMYLEKCISTILGQTYTQLEVILINDGSTDKSSAMCDSFAKQDDRVIVIHKKNGGVSAARNTGLSLCTGEFIVFVDSDDWLELDFIDHMINLQDTNSYDIVMAGIYEEHIPFNQSNELSYDAKAYIGKAEISNILPQIIKDGTINQLLSKMYKASFLKSIQLYFKEDLNLAEDALFNYEAFFEAKTFCISSKCLYHYAIRQNESLSKRINPLKFDMLVSINNRLLELIQTNQEYECALPSAMHIRFKNLYSCILDLFNKSCSLTYINKRKYIDSILKKENFKSYYSLDKKSYKLLAFILSSKNITLIYIVSAITAWSRRLRFRLKLLRLKLSGGHWI